MAALGAVVVLLAACRGQATGDDGAATVTTPAPAEATATSTEATVASAIETTTTVPPTSGEPGSGCINGWVTPVPGSALRTQPLDIIREQMGVSGEFHVVEMRYFIGPEVPWILAPRPPFVQWWYVKAQLVDDSSFRARWLVAKRWPSVEGIAAVAPFDTTGYRSPDWRGFLGEGEPRPIDGLPGSWVGYEFDFLAGEDDEKPGLPQENLHCLDGA